MKISRDDQKALSVILFYTALLFFLIGTAGRMKMEFHYREQIGVAGLTTAAVLAGLGVITLLLALRKQG